MFQLNKIIGTAYWYKLVERFHKRLNRGADDECWTWGLERPYGRIGGPGGRPILLHRLSYTIFKGPIPEPVGSPWSQHIRHTCDNPRCVNPHHLLVGSAADNAQDREQRGRGSHPRGEDAVASVLTNEQVLAIRADRRPLVKVAAQYNVSQSMIGKIKRLEAWSHLEGPAPYYNRGGPGPYRSFDVDKARQLRRQGMQLKEIGKRLGVAESTVSRAVRDNRR